MPAIIVVKTCDGDVYFPANREAFKWKAAELAHDQVLTVDSARWDDEEVRRVNDAARRGIRALYDTLKDIGALRIVELRS